MARMKKQARNRGLVVTRPNFTFRNDKFEVGDEFDPMEYALPSIKYIQLISARRISFGDIERSWEARLAAKEKEAKAKAEAAEALAKEAEAKDKKAVE